MRLSACVTTRNRPHDLDACLRALWNSSVKPCQAIVSDDSPDATTQEQNRRIVEQYSHSIYLVGPRAGVCANRNNALRAVDAADLVIFVDDDVWVDSDFIEKAIERYLQMPSSQQARSILSGVTRDLEGQEVGSTKLSFQGHFHPTDAPQAVNIHAAVFPWFLLHQEQWDENIFFGYEDAELCLRALKRGYRILHCPELKTLDMGAKQGTLAVEKLGNLTDYEVYIEAARLYVGIKRYKDLFPSVVKLVAFISVYAIHMTGFLLKRQSLNSWFTIIRRSNIHRLPRA